MHIQLNENGTYWRTLPDGNVEFSPTVFQPAHTLTPEQCEEFRVRPLERSAWPYFDPMTHRVEEGDPVLQDGQWVQVWNVIPLTAGEIAQKQAERIESIVNQTQQRLDDFARTRNYDSILSACTYATSTVPKFAAEGQYCVEARDATWAALYAIMDEVETGARPAPAGYADIENDLPALVWPT